MLYADSSTAIIFYKHVTLAYQMARSLLKLVNVNILNCNCHKYVCITYADIISSCACNTFSLTEVVVKLFESFARFSHLFSLIYTDYVKINDVT